MLRVLVLVLLLANAVYFAWSQQMLRAYGFAPTAQREPQRVDQQVRPDLVRVLSADEARGAEAAARQPECLVAGVLDDGQVGAVKQAAQTALPAGSWVLEPVAAPARWIVYMGKYPDQATLVKKRGEVIALGLRPEALVNPALEPGFSLAAFENEAGARAELAALGQRGVHTATVLLERGEQKGTQLKIATVDDALRARLDDLKAVLGGAPLRPCN